MKSGPKGLVQLLLFSVEIELGSQFVRLFVVITLSAKGSKNFHFCILLLRCSCNGSCKWPSHLPMIRIFSRCHCSGAPCTTVTFLVSECISYLSWGGISQCFLSQTWIWLQCHIYSNLLHCRSDWNPLLLPFGSL